MRNAINNRYEFVLLFDVKDGNPNGDPDAGNLPRIDPETGNGLVTDVCLKRKVRNYIGLVKGEEPPFEIYVKERAVLNAQHERAYDYLEEHDAIRKCIPNQLSIDEVKKACESIGKQCLSVKEVDSNHCVVLKPRSPLVELKKKCKPDKKKGIEEKTSSFIKELLDVAVDLEAKKWMCKNFYDVRAFGAVMSTGKWQCSQVRGPIQLGFGRSIDRIFSSEHTITVCAARKEDQPIESQVGIQGRKFNIPYGLYRVHGFISAPLAKQTGFSEEDLELFWNALLNMFDHDRSAARGEMAPQKLIVFKHDSALGNAPAQKLFDLVKVEKNCSDDMPPRSFSDYKVTPIQTTINQAPSGVIIQEML